MIDFDKVDILSDEFDRAIDDAWKHARLETLAAGVPVFYRETSTSLDVMEQPDGKRAELQVQLGTINENLAALRKGIATASKSVADEFQKTITQAVTERAKVEARIAALPPAEAAPNVAIQRLGAPQSTAGGETIEVSVALENTNPGPVRGGLTLQQVVDWMEQ